MSIARGDAVALTRELVRVDSRNPGLVAGGPGESEAARVLAAILEGWGLPTQVREAAPGRPCVISRTGNGADGTLMFNGHLDVVGVEGMRHDPFSGEVRDARIFGRGSADMKAGIAAMCAAAARTPPDSGTELVIVAVPDEEDRSIGTRSLVEWGVRADAAIVTEPTRLAIAPAHRGFAWFEITVHGRAAHGSRYDIGIDAIRHAAALLAELDHLEKADLENRQHPLLGHASLHASGIEGGTGWTTYPDECVLRLERRTVPGESLAMLNDEMASACDRVRARHPAFTADVRLVLSQEPSDVDPKAPIVQALSRAIERVGYDVRIEGLSAWTDAAILNAAGIPAICFGPGDIALAHSAEESVPISEIERCTDVLTALARDWSKQRS